MKVNSDKEKVITFAVMRSRSPIGGLEFIGRYTPGSVPTGVFKYSSLPVDDSCGLSFEHLSLLGLDAGIEYESPELFDTFADRIPPLSREDMRQFISRHNGVFDVIDYIKTTELSLVTDNLEVVYFGECDYENL